MKVKKLQKKKVYKRKEEHAFSYTHEILGILIVVLGVLLSLSLYFSEAVGIFGSLSKDFLLGMLGLTAFILPPIVIFYGILVLIKKNDDNLNQKAMYISFLIFIISALIQTGFFSAREFQNLKPIKSIELLYNKGITLMGGGVIGGIICMPLLKLFQVLGTIIILSTLAIVDIILLTNISFLSTIKKVCFIISKLFIWKFNKSLISTKEKQQKIHKVSKTENLLSVENENDEEIRKEAQLLKIIDFNLKSQSKKETANTFNYEMLDKKLETNEIQKEAIKKEEINKEISRSIDTHIKYTYPPLNLLNSVEGEGVNIKEIRNAALEGAKKLEDTLKSFGVEARVINVSRGPAVTRYELQPSPGVKVSKIVNLADDISLNLASAGVRIEAPIPGKAAIGIEVPNKEMIAVTLKEVLDSQDFVKNPSKLAFALGKDISGEPIIADIAKMPHVLIAGATGSGKSVCINSIITSLLYKSSPDEVKLLMIDPKVVELGIYNGIPHLLIPVVTDPKKAAGALNWAVQEMINRYKLFAEKGARDLKGYNSIMKEDGQEIQLPQIVIIIDELADLMMVAPNDVEDAICRLAQMARAAGMHLVIATQRPSVDVITGVIKANIPSRIAFAVSSQVDSRTIIDMGGAEKLLGKGDMLFYPVGEPKPIRVKGTFISDKEVEKVVEYIKSQTNASYNNDIIEEINNEKEREDSNVGDNDDLLPQAIEMVVEAGQASTSLLQRRFKVGYARAGRIIDQMHARGIIGPFEGSKPRQVLINRQQLMEMQMSSMNK